MGIERSFGFENLSDEEKDIVRKKAWQPSALDLIPGVGLARMIIKPYVYHGSMVDDGRVGLAFYQVISLMDIALYTL